MVEASLLPESTCGVDNAGVETLQLVLKIRHVCDRDSEEDSLVWTEKNERVKGLTAASPEI